MSRVVSAEFKSPATDRLLELEGVIDRNLKTFIETGRALQEIRDSNLYFPVAPTFEVYIRERFGMRKQHAYRLMDAVVVVKNITSANPDLPPPVNESQARPLVRIKDPQDQTRVWEEALQKAQEKDEKFMARHVQQAVRGFRRSVETETEPKPSDESRDDMGPNDSETKRRGQAGRQKFEEVVRQIEKIGDLVAGNACKPGHVLTELMTRSYPNDLNREKVREIRDWFDDFDKAWPHDHRVQLHLIET